LIGRRARALTGGAGMRGVALARPVLRLQRMDGNDEIPTTCGGQLRERVYGQGGGLRAVVPRPEAPAERRISVVDWLLAVGHVVARRLRRAPRSPMVALHPKP
jgi:hypothetical protein